MARIRRFFRVLGLTKRYLTLGRRKPARIDGVKSRWAREILRTFRMDLTVSGRVDAGPVLFVGNHVSYLDIPLLMAHAPVHFLAKREIGRWPLFGDAMRVGGTLFVDRSSKDSRAEAGHSLAKLVRHDGKAIAVFPSGTTTVDESVPWRQGVFRIAHEHGIPIQPFRLSYEPLRPAAFIGKDTFVPHLWKLLGLKVKARLEFGETRRVEDPQRECTELWRWSQAMID